MTPPMIGRGEWGGAASWQAMMGVSRPKQQEASDNDTYMVCVIFSFSV